MPSGAGFAAVVAVCAAVCAAEPTMQHDDRPITLASSKDPVAPTDAMVETAVAKLLSGMTVEEKARQLVIEDAIGCCVTNGYFNASKAAAFFGTVGAGVLDSAGRNVDPALMNQIQAAAVKASRHQIGAILAEECQHGVQGDWHTLFPSPYSIAAAFDRDLMRKIGGVIGTEARAGATAQCWSPVCGLAREPRWGRAEEEMGEDVYLAGELAGSMAAGMVGGDYHNLVRPNTTMPLLKHYAAHSVPEGGINAAPGHLGRRELRETFLPVFRKAIEAGAQGIMSSYNEVDGVPTSSDPFMLTDQLRDEMGFTGYTMSDFGAISMLGPSQHAVAANDSECVRMYIEAGGSVNGHDFDANYEKLVAGLIKSGGLTMAQLDTAVGNVLRVKGRLGLIPIDGLPFQPLVSEDLVATSLGDNPDHAAIALRASRESVVLLSNAPFNGKPVLPLSVESTKRVLVLGPNADEARSGDYSAAGWAGGAPNGGGNIDNKNTVTILEGLKLDLPKAEIVQMVATGLGGGNNTAPYFTVVQRHSLATAAAFTPTAHSSPYKPVPTGGIEAIAAGTEGLKASYFAGTELAGEPTLVRLDYAVNFHFFALGPDPTRFRNGTFSVRWEGVITPDATVDGALLQLILCHGSDCIHNVNPAAPKDLGGRVYLDGACVVDAWKPGGKMTSQPVNLTRGVSRHIVIEYFQGEATGNEGVALQWSLLPSIVPGGNKNSATTIEQAAAEVSTGKYDAVVVCLGGANNKPYISTTEGEGVDRASLSLAGNQLDLLTAAWTAAQAANTPLAVVLVDGKPTAEPFLKELPAVIAAFQGGQSGGQAVADVLTGLVNPSGKLPISFPASAAVLPSYYNYKPTAARRGWIDFPHGGVLWPFGHGLSYTTFHYSELVLPRTAVPADGMLEVSVKVTNNGTVYGEEVAQLYLRDEVASVTTPNIQLRGFERVALNPSASTVVTFLVNVTMELRILNRNYEWEVEPGTFTAYVGGTSESRDVNGTFSVGLAENTPHTSEL